MLPVYVQTSLAADAQCVIFLLHHLSPYHVTGDFVSVQPGFLLQKRFRQQVTI